MSDSSELNRELLANHGFQGSVRRPEPERPVVQRKGAEQVRGCAGVRDASCQTESKVKLRHVKMLRLRLEMADRQLDALESALEDISLSPQEEKEE